LSMEAAPPSKVRSVGHEETQSGALTPATLTPADADPGDATIQVLPGKLAAPRPVAPTGVIQSATPTFSWSPVTGAVYYDVSVDDSTTGQTQVVRNQHVSSTSFTPASPLTPGDSYQWMVRAFNSTSVAGAWSTAVAFTIAGAGPAMPTPLTPTGTIQSATPTFSCTRFPTCSLAPRNWSLCMSIHPRC
jgi:hypothetical protein